MESGLLFLVGVAIGGGVFYIGYDLGMKTAEKMYNLHWRNK